MENILVPIRGMHCKSCEILIEDKIKKIPGVKKVEVSYGKGKAQITYQGSCPSEQSLRAAVEEAGYEIGEKKKLPWFSKNPEDYFFLLIAAVLLAIFYLFGSSFGLFDISANTTSNGLWVVPVVGLVAGFSSCMALIGGLVLGLSARHAELHPEATRMQKFRPHLFFNLGRILGYTVLGAVIGLLGSAFKPSASTLGLMTIIVGGVMIFLGLKLIEIFPVLKDKTLTLPKSISKALGMRKENKEYSHKSAMMGGVMTFFLPCGFTQAMQLYAVSTGSAVQGALIMGLFALGTAPGLLGIGGLSSLFKGLSAKLFFMTAGLAVIFLGIFNITNASHLVFSGSGNNTVAGAASGQVQEVKMTQSNSGYSPNSFTVKKGQTVRWVINSTSPYSCSATILLPKYGISQSLKQGENVIEFTPTETGQVPFSCSMGMYRGSFNVVDNGTTGSLPAPTTDTALAGSGGGSCGSGRGGCGCGGGSKKPVQTTEGKVQQAAGTQVIKSVYTYKDDIVPNTFTVKSGVPVRMEIDVKDDGFGCMSTIKIPQLSNNPQPLQKGKTLVMEFTPTQTGDFPITCAMGVRRGKLTVN